MCTHSRTSASASAARRCAYTHIHGADLSALAKAARKAARLSLQDVRGKVKQLTNTIERTDRGVKQVAKLPQAQRMGVERFEESIGEFLRQASMQGEATATNFAEVERAYVKTVMFMTCDPEAKAQKVECDEFWGLLADFLEEQQRAIVKERERLAKLAGGSGGAAGGAGGDRGETKRFKPRHKAGTKLKIEGAGDGEGGGGGLLAFAKRVNKVNKSRPTGAGAGRNATVAEGKTPGADPKTTTAGEVMI